LLILECCRRKEEEVVVVSEEDHDDDDNDKIEATAAVVVVSSSSSSSSSGSDSDFMKPAMCNYIIQTQVIQHYLLSYATNHCIPINDNNNDDGDRMKQ
jgi:hypothetical protein